jgi:hypothetical protein
VQELSEKQQDPDVYREGMADALGVSVTLGAYDE